MVGIHLSTTLAIAIGLLGGLWIYTDGRKRNIQSADMYAVGFFVGMFIPPIIGAVIAIFLYLQKRNQNGGSVHALNHR